MLSYLPSQPPSFSDIIYPITRIPGGLFLIIINETLKQKVKSV